MPKILIADPFDSAVREEFIRDWSEKGYKVEFKPDLKGQGLAQELASGGYDALIVGSKEVEGSTLHTWRQATGSKPLCVIRAGSDPSHIAVGTAAELGIPVMNTPGASKIPVANYVLNRLPHDGKGKTLALIGYGEIGREVARAARDRGFIVQVYSPHFTPEQAEQSGLRFAASAEDAVKNSDFIVPTAHLLQVEQAEKLNRIAGKIITSPSQGIIDGEALEQANAGVQVISPSRPWLFDIPALEEALETGHVATLSFNTTPHDIEVLGEGHPGLFGDRSTIEPSGKFLPAEAKQEAGRRALMGVIGFFERGKIELPVFPPELLSYHQRNLDSQNTMRSWGKLFTHPQQTILAERRREVFDESNIITESIETPYAKIFLTREKEATPQKYAYSGVRVLSPMSDEAAIQNAKRLSLTSSSWKNWLINHAVKEGALSGLSGSSKAALPETVWTKREIYGGRAIIIPHKGEYKGVSIETILKDSDHPLFPEVSTPIYEAIGKHLNALGGKLKVTPDFGPNASTADIMYQHTPHVLGISAEKNGSGGKSEYSITSILTAAKKLGVESMQRDTPITLIGSAGALGSGVTAYFARLGFTNVTLCDLDYEKNPPATLPDGWKIAKAVEGKFTDECLERGGVLVTTAYGDEMLASNWKKMKPGTVWIGAQNKDLPEKEEGIAFAKALQQREILHVPGQIMTIGGTIASWVEWCSREANRAFSKEAAHEVVSHITGRLLTSMMEQSKAQQITPYEAMLDYAHKQHWQGHTAAVTRSRGQQQQGFVAKL